MPVAGTAAATVPAPKGEGRDYATTIRTTGNIGTAIKIVSPIAGALMFTIGLMMYQENQWMGSTEIGVLLVVSSILLAAFGFIGGTIVCGQAHTMQILLDNCSK